jgi:hypothetical protein
MSHVEDVASVVGQQEAEKTRWLEGFNTSKEVRDEAVSAIRGATAAQEEFDKVRNDN